MLWKLVNVLNFSFSFDRRNTLYFLDKSLFESYAIFEYLFLSFYVKRDYKFKRFNVLGLYVLGLKKNMYLFSFEYLIAVCIKLMS